jgi:chromosome partitioning protein
MQVCLLTLKVVFLDNASSINEVIMIITVTSFKGGVGKTTTAVHLGAHFQKFGPTLLIDGDLNRSATGWAARGNLPFRVFDEMQGVRFARQYEHIIIDTGARPNPDELETLAGGCDLLLIPTTPDALALEALKLTVEALENMQSRHYRILLTMLPAKPCRDGEEARTMLENAGLPLLDGGISRLMAFQRAALSGVPVNVISDPRAERGWAEYERIGGQIRS